jgi:Ribbon-helix-helix protein, copG family
MHKGPIQVYPRRTSIRLTVEADERLGELVRDRGCSKAEVVRQLIMAAGVSDLLPKPGKPVDMAGGLLPVA